MLRLIIVEDDGKQIKLYKDAIDEFNAGSDIKIDIEIGNNLEEGLKQIRTNDFDAAIIDLRLGSEDMTGNGKQIIKEIKSNLRFPVFVLTGHPGDLDECLRKENDFYKVYGRTDKETINVLHEISNIYKTGITKIMGRKGIFDTTLQKVFWENFSESMGYWKTEIQDGNKIEKVLSRHILAHLSERLRLTEEGEFEKCHPAEVYIMPSIKKDFFTGDILKNKNESKYSIILTPACDIAQNKAKFIVLSEIEIFSNFEYFKQQERIINNPDKDQNEKNDAKNKIESLLTNNDALKYHFLPSFKEFPGGFINFQKVTSVKYKDLGDERVKIAEVFETFLKDIIARFSNYYARQGSPDFDIDIILEKLIND